MKKYNSYPTDLVEVELFEKIPNCENFDMGSFNSETFSNCKFAIMCIIINFGDYFERNSYYDYI